MIKEYGMDNNREKLTDLISEELSDFEEQVTTEYSPKEIYNKAFEISRKANIYQELLEMIDEGPLTNSQVDALLEHTPVIENIYEHSLLIEDNSHNVIVTAILDYADRLAAEHDKHYYFEHAQKYINEFCDREYGSTADFSNINEVGIGYTTVTDDEIELQVNADLENYQIKYYLDNRLYKTEDYDNLKDMVENALSVLDFNELVYTVEKDPDEQIQAFVNVDTHISVSDKGIAFNIAKVDEFVMKGTYSEYIGGMDENGHEAKDNYQQYDTSLSLRLEGAKVISEIYDERDMFSPYTEDIFDLLEDGGRETLEQHIAQFYDKNEVSQIYTIKDGAETPLDTMKYFDADIDDFLKEVADEAAKDLSMDKVFLTYYGNRDSDHLGKFQKSVDDSISDAIYNVFCKTEQFNPTERDVFNDMAINPDTLDKSFVEGLIKNVNEQKDVTGRARDAAVFNIEKIVLDKLVGDYVDEIVEDNSKMDKVAEYRHGTVSEYRDKVKEDLEHRFLYNDYRDTLTTPEMTFLHDSIDVDKMLSRAAFDAVSTLEPVMKIHERHSTVGETVEQKANKMADWAEKAKDKSEKTRDKDIRSVR